MKKMVPSRFNRQFTLIDANLTRRYELTASGPPSHAKLISFDRINIIYGIEGEGFRRRPLGYGGRDDATKNAETDF